MNLEQTFSSGRGFSLQRPGRAPGSAPHHSPASEQKRAPAHGRLCCNCNRPNPDPNRPFVCWACAFVQWVLPNLARDLARTYVEGRRLVVKTAPKKPKGVK